MTHEYYAEREDMKRSMGGYELCQAEALCDKQDAMSRDVYCDDVDGRYRRYREDVASVYRGRGRISTPKKYFFMGKTGR